ncbi:hypothetical protein BZG36_04116 [Bifiguratus adelaidae]|uniref:NmrA-like domain-containing protein n=1 Tax=Bifiguratus adelaidae TaxID=1938954 RepID=A0A261XX67_9FUNG|nr:hypothetical protein BZG36_04116 [Bifiguratus adelaidae]
MTKQTHILVTGATGELGRLVIKHLLQRSNTTTSHIIAGVRDLNIDVAKSLAQSGAELRVADYDKPETLDAAFTGVDKVLLISSNIMGDRRVQQHINAINAAKRAGVKLLAYTSILKADTTHMKLANDHRQTEKAIMDSGVPFVIFRNGWYTENYFGSLASTVEHGVQLGSSWEGRISAAPRSEYADAAAVVLLSTENQQGRIYELAGDEAFTLSEYAAELSRQSGKPVVYKNLAESEYKATLVGFGLPEPVAAILADSDAQASKGALFNDSRQISALIGHPTTPLAKVLPNVLAH